MKKWQQLNLKITVIVMVECSNLQKDNYCILISECDLQVE